MYMVTEELPDPDMLDLDRQITASDQADQRHSHSGLRVGLILPPRYLACA